MKSSRHQRDAVVQPAGRVKACSVVRRHRRRDAIHQRVGESDVAVDPRAEFRIAGGREADEGGPRHFAVVSQVVTRHHGERFDTGRASPRQGLDDDAEHRARCAVAGEVSGHVGVVGDECAGVRIDVVPAFGDGQRDDAQVRVGQQREHLVRLIRGEQVVELGADHAHIGFPFRRRDGERVQAILGTELRRLLPAPLTAKQTDADDPPILLARQCETAVDVEGLMCAVEIADPEVRDAALEPTAVVGRRRHLWWQLRKRAFVELGDVTAPSARGSTPTGRR